MAQYRNIGMSREQFQKTQTIKEDEDFKFNTNQRIQNLQFAIDMINKALSDSIANQGSQKVYCDNIVNNIGVSLAESLRKFSQQLDDFRVSVKIYSSVTACVSEEVKECVSLSSFKEKISLLEGLIEKLHRDREELRKEFKEANHRLSQEFDGKLKAQKTEILNMPSEIPAMRKLFDQKLEIVELNGQNAILRSSNNERQLTLIEKKIENIYQLMKKFDLTKQELS